MRDLMKPFVKMLPMTDEKGWIVKCKWQQNMTDYFELEFECNSQNTALEIIKMLVNKRVK